MYIIHVRPLARRDITERPKEDGTRTHEDEDWPCPAVVEAEGRVRVQRLRGWEERDQTRAERRVGRALL